MVELDDEIAHIRSGDLDSLFLQVLLQLDLLAHHGLGLDHTRDRVFFDELRDDGASILGRLRVVHLDAILGRLRLKLCHQGAQMRHRVALESAGLTAQRLPIVVVLTQALSAVTLNVVHGMIKGRV